MDFHRKICNNVKKELITTIVESLKDNGIDSITLIDLCCGRGGDIFKWDKAKIDKVLAFDNHEESLKEAISRYKKVSSRIKSRINFIKSDVSTIDISKHIKQKVPLITCQFSLHYFDLETILTKISNSLTKGGYFIGVVPDGDIIEQCLYDDTLIENVTLERAGPNSYFINLFDKKDTNKTESYFNYRKESLKESFVRKKDLEVIANKVSLKLCNYYNLQDKWNGNHISKLYFSFVFQKV